MYMCYISLCYNCSCYICLVLLYSVVFALFFSITLIIKKDMKHSFSNYVSARNMLEKVNSQGFCIHCFRLMGKVYEISLQM